MALLTLLVQRQKDHLNRIYKTLSMTLPTENFFVLLICFSQQLLVLMKSFFVVYFLVIFYVFFFGIIIFVFIIEDEHVNVIEASIII